MTVVPIRTVERSLAPMPTKAEREALLGALRGLQLQDAEIELDSFLEGYGSLSWMRGWSAREVAGK